MKLKFLLFSTLFSLLIDAAPVLPVIYSGEENTRAKVTETGTFQEIPSPGTRNDSATPRGSTAGRLAVNGREFFWKPSQIKGKVTGGADLITAVLSEDETALLIAERIGGKGNLNSTRLIFLNLRNKKIIRSVLLNERRISDLRFIPGTDQLIAVQDAQEQFEHRNSILKINLRRGTVIAESSPETDRIQSVAASDSKLWYTVKNTPFIFEILLDNLSRKPVAVRTRISDPRLEISPDGSTLAVYGESLVERFKVSDEKAPSLMQSFTLNRGFSPSDILILDDKANMILLIEPEKQAVLCHNGIAKNIPEKCGSVFTYFKKEKLLLLGLLKHNAIAGFRMPSVEIDGKPTVPGKLKPLSRNGNWKLLALSGNSTKALLIDIRGNVMFLEINKRRWKKYPVLTVDKTGFR